MIEDKLYSVMIRNPQHSTPIECIKDEYLKVL